MKHNNIHIMSAMLFIALFASSLPAYADAVITSVEYMPEAESSSYGSIVATPVPGTSNWILEAVPADDTKWRFKKWSDDNTDNPRTVSFTDLSADFTVVFTRFIYTNCYSDKEYMTVVDNPAAPNNYGYIDTNTVDGVLYAEAIPNTGYTFAQWADGSYVNPRPFQNDGSSTSTLYATFIPTATKGQVDTWAKDGFVLTTTESEGALDEGVLTMFVNGELVSSVLPAQNESGYDGVYKMNLTYESAFAGKNCHIVYKNGSCEPVATLDAVIPVLVDSEEEVVVPNSGTGVHVLEGGVATLAEDQTIAELDVYAGGRAVVEGNVTASSVTMRADCPNYLDVPVPDLLVKGSLVNTNSNTINLDYTLDYENYYAFALPYTINTNSVTYKSGEDARESFVLGYYDGEARAHELPAWKTYYDYVGYGDSGDPDYIAPSGDKNIESGVGYNIFGDPMLWNGDEQFFGYFRFPMTVDLSSGGESVRSISVQQHDGEKYNKNWNLIALPYLSSYRGRIKMYKDEEYVADLKYVTLPVDNFTAYEAKLISSTTLLPFQPYFIQSNDDVNKLVFEAPNPDARAAMPKRKVSQSNNDDELMAGISLSQNGRSDQTGLFIAEAYTNGYDINADLAKMNGSKKKVHVFSLSNSQKLAYIALPPANGQGVLETIIPLGYDNAKVNEELTFSIDKYNYPEMLENEDLIALELVDNVMGETTDLLSSDYTCTAYQKADNSRFALNVRYKAKAPQIITGVDESTIRATSLPDGVYDLLGRPINTQTLPAGAYIVVENGQTRKEVIR